MRRKIQKSMVLVITLTLVITYALLTAIVYGRTVRLMEAEVRQEADYICRAIEISGTGYLKQLDSVQENTRITWIDQEGNVLYDSTEENNKIENHASRPEVQEAMKKGSGQEIRKSDTVGQEMFYYARKLSDGTILRVSKTIDSVARSALVILPIMAALAIVMILLAWILSKWQVTRLIRPINRLNLENPLENDV